MTDDGNDGKLVMVIADDDDSVTRFNMNGMDFVRTKIFHVRRISPWSKSWATLLQSGISR